MGRPSPVRTKAFTAIPAGGQTTNLQKRFGTPSSLTKSTQRNFGEDPTEDGKAPDIATQMTHALQFGHNFSQTANMASVQRQPKEEEEVNLKPDSSLQRQAATQEEEKKLNLKPAPSLQRQVDTQEDEEELNLKPDPSLQRQADTQEDEEEIYPKLNIAELQRRQDKDEELQRQPEDDKELQPKLIQTKLSIGQPGDKYEQEADHMASKVMAMPEPQGLAQEGSNRGKAQNDASLQRQINVASLLQRETLDEKKDDELAMKPLIQLKGDAPKAPDNFESQLASHRGSGQPLSDETRAFMEPRFGTDFSGVRVHETPDLANAIQAQAFTHGQDIYFNSGKYNPGSSRGKELLAHELTHVVQQTPTNIQCRESEAKQNNTTYWDWYHNDPDGQLYQTYRKRLEPKGYKFRRRVAIGQKSDGSKIWKEGSPQKDTLAEDVAWRITLPSRQGSRKAWANIGSINRKCETWLGFETSCSDEISMDGSSPILIPTQEVYIEPGVVFSPDPNGTEWSPFFRQLLSSAYNETLDPDSLPSTASELGKIGKEVSAWSKGFYVGVVERNGKVYYKIYGDRGARSGISGRWYAAHNLPKSSRELGKLINPRISLGSSLRSGGLIGGALTIGGTTLDYATDPQKDFGSDFAVDVSFDVVKSGAAGAAGAAAGAAATGWLAAGALGATVGSAAPVIGTVIGFAVGILAAMAIEYFISDCRATLKAN